MQLSRRHSRLFFVILLVVIPFIAKAQTDSTLRKHVIITLDHYPFNCPLFDASVMVPQIESILLSLNLTDSDYVSVVNYGLGTQDESFKNYSVVAVNRQPYVDFRRDLSKRWDSITIHSNAGAPFSLITGSNYYSFHAFYENHEGRYSNRVFLLNVTDHYYNGADDYMKEFKSYKDSQGRLSSEEFNATISSVKQQYNFDRKKEILLPAPNYKVILYEVSPHSSPSLNTVIDYPANLGLQRVRGGYKLVFSYHSLSSEYQVRKLEVCPMGNDGFVGTEVCTGREGDVEMFINSSDVSGDSVKVVLKGWLERTDSIYSGLILNPYDERNKLLNVSLTIPLNDTPKILGFIPLFDIIWWWYPNDALWAVFIWDLILVVVLILLLFYLFYKWYNRIITYKPSNQDIIITKIE